MICFLYHTSQSSQQQVHKISLVFKYPIWFSLETYTCTGERQRAELPIYPAPRALFLEWVKGLTQGSKETILPNTEFKPATFQCQAQRPIPLSHCLQNRDVRYIYSSRVSNLLLSYYHTNHGSSEGPSPFGIIKKSAVSIHSGLPSEWIFFPHSFGEFSES